MRIPTAHLNPINQIKNRCINIDSRRTNRLLIQMQRVQISKQQHRQSFILQCMVAQISDPRSVRLLREMHTDIIAHL